MACSANLDFVPPLPVSELCSIARSVAKSTFRRYNPATFSRIQQQRSLRRWAGHVAASTTRPWDAEGISRAAYYRKQRRGDFVIFRLGSTSSKTVGGGALVATVLRLSPRDDASTLRLEAA